MTEDDDNKQDSGDGLRRIERPGSSQPLSGFGQALKQALRGVERPPTARSDATSEEPHEQIRSSHPASAASPQTGTQRVGGGGRNTIGAGRLPANLSGAETQCSGETIREERELVLGFDLGTSCTKIVIQDVDARYAYAVQFGDVSCPGYPFLLPTSVAVSNQGIFDFSHGHRVERLKTIALAKPARTILRSRFLGDIAAEEILAGYIAAALRRARRWFLQEHAAIYSGIRILWSLNIGMPARQYDDPILTALLKHIGVAAWAASTVPADISVSSVRECLKAARERALPVGVNPVREAALADTWLHSDLVVPTPEVVAEVKGYVDSPLKRTGLHLLVDIGASTLDVAMFNVLQSRDEHTYPILSCEVRPLGAYMLHLYKLRQFATIVNQRMREQSGMLDPVRASSDMHAITELQESDIEEMEHAFRNDVGEFVALLVTGTRKGRDPLSRQWVSGVPVFICGGGRDIPLYKAAIRRVNESFAGLGAFEYLELPKPASLRADGLASAEYHRLAVAYGLSFRAADIGKTVRPRDIRDLVQEPKERAYDNYVSKDMV